jgi:nucleoside-diphosphate-sugar epimerase
MYEDAPLRASRIYPELRDVVEMDQRAETWLHCYEDKIHTTILRTSGVIGEELNNGITTFLTSNLSFYPIDFNPSLQFVYQSDLVNCICSSIEQNLHGVFNITGPGFLSAKEAVTTVNPKAYPVPITALQFLNKTLNKTFIKGVSPYLIDYFKYSCLISNKAWEQRFGEDYFEYDALSALKKLTLRTPKD